MSVINHTISGNWQGQNGSTVPASNSIGGAVETNANETIAATTVDQSVPFSFSHTTGQLFWLLSDQNIQMNVNAIHSGAPILTVNLIAGEPYIWHSQNYQAMPFSADVTNLYFSNAGGTAANVKIRTLRN